MNLSIAKSILFNSKDKHLVLQKLNWVIKKWIRFYEKAHLRSDLWEKKSSLNGARTHESLGSNTESIEFAPKIWIFKKIRLNLRSVLKISRLYRLMICRKPLLLTIFLKDLYGNSTWLCRIICKIYEQNYVHIVIRILTKKSSSLLLRNDKLPPRLMKFLKIQFDNYTFFLEFIIFSKLFFQLKESKVKFSRCHFCINWFDLFPKL